jgi:DNA-binding transcriptional regulator PaaX
MIVDADVVNGLPFSENTRRAAIHRLKEAGLVAEIRMRERRFLALLDPELLSTPPNK